MLHESTVSAIMCPVKALNLGSQWNSGPEAGPWWGPSRPASCQQRQKQNTHILSKYQDCNMLELVASMWTGFTTIFLSSSWIFLSRSSRHAHNKMKRVQSAANRAYTPQTPTKNTKHSKTSPRVPYLHASPLQSSWLEAFPSCKVSGCSRSSMARLYS